MLRELFNQIWLRLSIARDDCEIRDDFREREIQGAQQNDGDADRAVGRDRRMIPPQKVSAPDSRVSCTTTVFQILLLAPFARFCTWRAISRSKVQNADREQLAL